MVATPSPPVPSLWAGGAGRVGRGCTTLRHLNHRGAFCPPFRPPDPPGPRASGKIIENGQARAGRAGPAGRGRGAGPGPFSSNSPRPEARDQGVRGGR